MADESKKAKGGSKLARSEITTVRLDPKLRYLAELAARKQRRTLSSFIEWAIEDTLSRFAIKETADWQATVGAEADYLWDVDPADRFARLALRYPELLTHDEQVMWKLVRENGYFWKGRFAKNGGRWEWDIYEQKLIYERLRDFFAEVIAVASGVVVSDALPQWHRTQAEEMADPSGDLDCNVLE